MISPAPNPELTADLTANVASPNLPATAVSPQNPDAHPILMVLSPRYVLKSLFLVPTLLFPRISRNLAHESPGKDDVFAS